MDTIILFIFLTEFLLFLSFLSLLVCRLTEVKNVILAKPLLWMLILIKTKLIRKHLNTHSM